jgi:hypothetical protein
MRHGWQSQLGALAAWQKELAAASCGILAGVGIIMAVMHVLQPWNSRRWRGGYRSELQPLHSDTPVLCGT